MKHEEFTPGAHETLRDAGCRRFDKIKWSSRLDAWCDGYRLAAHAVALDADAPALLAENERLRARNAKLRAAADAAFRQYAHRTWTDPASGGPATLLREALAEKD